MSAFPDGDENFEAVYAEEAATIDASEVLARALESSGITRTDLARRLGVSKSEITHRLRGERNITVRKLAATLFALGHELEIGAVKLDTSHHTRYADLLPFLDHQTGWGEEDLSLAQIEKSNLADMMNFRRTAS
jgi:transcriptional regulator with XRE-family HTH domain